MDSRHILKKLVRAVLWCLMVGFAIACGFYVTAVIWGLALIGSIPGATLRRVGEVFLISIVWFVSAAACGEVRRVLKG